MTLAGGALVLLEIQTHVPAAWLGEILNEANAYRQRKGGPWASLRASGKVQAVLGGPTEERLAGQGGLPEPVAVARFELERVPGVGLPTFIAVWRTGLSADHQQHRTTPEVVQSLNVFRKGHALLELARLPDTRYRAQVQQQVRDLYRQVGTPEWADTLEVGRPEFPGAVTLADSTPVISPDTVRAAVESELAEEFLAALKKEEQERLLSAFDSGEISQIVIQRGMGTYQGEAIFVDPRRAPVGFEVPADAVADLFRVGGTP